MDIFIKRLRSFFLCLLTSFKIVFACSHLEVDQALNQEFKQALEHCEKQEWEEGFTLLKSITAPSFKAEAQKICGDICFMEKDGPHSLKEAALYYLLAAHNGNPSIFNYIEESVPGIFKLPRKTQFEKLVNFWVNDATRYLLNKEGAPNPIEINNYLLNKGYTNSNQLKTFRQKIPYFFHKALILLLNTHLLETDGETLSNKNQEKFLLSCRAEVNAKVSNVYTEKFVGELQPWKLGPVYLEYYQNEDCVFTQSSLEKREILYPMILDIVAQHIQIYRTTQSLISMLHQELPWVLAGLEFLQYKELSYTFNNNGEFSSLGKIDRVINELKEAIRLNKELDSKIEAKLNSMVKFIEKEDPFPVAAERNEAVWDNVISQYTTSSYERKEISGIERIDKEYQQNTILYFLANRSLKNELITNIFNSFKERLVNQCVSLQSTDGSIKFLKTPLVIFYIQNLTLKYVEPSEEHLGYLKIFYVIIFTLRIFQYI